MKKILLPLLAVIVLGLTGAAAVETQNKGPAPIKISHGAEVNLTDYLVPGKTTIFDFTSQYCPPCQAISPRLDQLHSKREDIVVVKIDINRANVKHIDWQSPVAKQYKIQSIPQFKIYGPDGKLISEGKEATAKVYSWVE